MSKAVDITMEVIYFLILILAILILALIIYHTSIKLEINFT
ncbi:MAG: hypothetical protein ACUVQ8_01055 [Nitrososphaeria archaeon]